MPANRQAMLAWTEKLARYYRVPVPARELALECIEDYLTFATRDYEEGAVLEHELTDRFIGRMQKFVSPQNPWKAEHAWLWKEAHRALGFEMGTYVRSRSSSVLAFVLACPLQEAELWVPTWLEASRAEKSPLESDRDFEGRHSGKPIRVRLSPCTDARTKGPWLRIEAFSLDGNPPWEWDVDFARLVFRGLKRRTTCEPGELRDPDSLNPDEQWVIDRDGERVECLS